MTAAVAGELCRRLYRLSVCHTHSIYRRPWRAGGRYANILHAPVYIGTTVLSLSELPALEQYFIQLTTRLMVMLFTVSGRIRIL